MLDEIFPWVKRFPSLTAIVLALALAALGHFLDAHGLMTFLAKFTAWIEQSLHSFDALNIGTVFYRELTGCELLDGDVACAPGPDTYDRLRDTALGKPENGLFATILFAVVNTISIVFGQTTWFGILFYLLAIIASAAVLAQLIEFDDWGPFGIVLLVVLAPALASFIALGFKWLLLLLVLVFSQVLAGIMLFVTTFGSVIAYAQAGNAVLTGAHKIDTLALTPTQPGELPGAPDQKPPDPA